MCVDSSALDGASEPIVHDIQKSRLETDRRNNKIVCVEGGGGEAVRKVAD